jgi:hypothetical protein
MPISHELSSEIAAALLARKDRSPREREELKETLLLVHSTLQKLADEADKRTEPEPTTKQATAGS